MMGELCEMGLYHGLEGVANINLALGWYRMAIVQGHDRAMFNVAALYEKGDVVGRDMTKSMRLYKEAEKKDNARAIDRLRELSEVVQY